MASRLMLAALAVSLPVALAAACLSDGARSPETPPEATVLVETIVEIPRTVEVEVTREVFVPVFVEITKEVPATVVVEVTKEITIVWEVLVTREVPVTVIAPREVFEETLCNEDFLAEFERRYGPNPVPLPPTATPTPFPPSPTPQPQTHLSGSDSSRVCSG